jgi:protein subunit release factor B
MKKTKLFSVSVKDCRVDTFIGSGAGGQHKQKTSSGVRVTHEPSGAIGKCSENREQHINKRTAFRKMAESKEFKNWVKLQAAKLEGKPTVEELVEQAMNPKNLKVEVRGPDGSFIPEEKICNTQH